MSELLLPADENEVAALIATAGTDALTLAVNGGGTRSGLGRPIVTDAAMSTKNLTGITLYEPAEQVLSARAGTPVAEIEQALAGHGQRLAFEPMDHRSIYGTPGEATPGEPTPGEPTIGAVAAANLSGPRRIEVGAARDSLIGLRAVTGRGEAIHSGGRVMKNVTGYDLVKLLAGSYGTLAVLTEVTFKVSPVPETERTIAISGLDPEGAVGLLSAGLGSPYALSGAAHLPGEAGSLSTTVMRLEGFATSVVQRCDKLIARLGKPAKLDVLDETASKELWASVRDLRTLRRQADAPLWRISVKPSDGPAVAAAIAGPADSLQFDWGGGLIWLAGGEGTDAGTKVIRAAVQRHGGHATLIKASAEIKEKVEVFQPLTPTLMALTRQFKQSFDPSGILNPGRMYAGI